MLFVAYASCRIISLERSITDSETMFVFVASICDGVTCPPDKRCAVDERYQPTCVCIEQCLRVGYPVCGSDGHTYLNECELQKEACMRNTSVTIAYRGKCDQGM